MKTHIDFFKANVTDWNKKRFSEKDNMAFIPERHQELFRRGLAGVRGVDGEGQFVIVAFYREDVPKPVFKYLTYNQLQQLKININWRDNQTRNL